MERYPCTYLRMYMRITNGTWFSAVMFDVFCVYCLKYLLSVCTG